MVVKNFATNPDNRADQLTIVLPMVITHSKIADLLDILNLSPSEGEVREISVTVQLRGLVCTGNNEFAAPTSRGLSLETVGLLLACAGCTRESAMSLAVCAAKGDLPNEKQDTILAFVESFKRAMLDLPPIERAGKRTGKLTVELIG